MCVAKFMSTPIYLIIMPPCVKSWVPPVADLGGRKGCAPPGSKFFQFHTVFEKIWQNLMLAPPPPREVGAFSLGKSWILH